MTVIKITVIHSKGYNQITMGIETLRNIVIITTDIFAVWFLGVKTGPFGNPIHLDNYQLPKEK